eukprot:91491_1
MSCKSGWYKTHFYPGESFAVVQPSKVIECTENTTTTTTESPASLSEAETATMVFITMLLGLLFLFFVMMRSCSKTRSDWYRLIGVYILGTIGVPISITFAPAYGGFNRVVGFGILVHNMGELLIISHIWFGDVNHKQQTNYNRYAGIFTVLYVWVIMTLIAFLPQTPLFLVLMIQGASCDWTLVGTMIYLGIWMHTKAPSGDIHHKSMGWFSSFGIAAAVIHILSIQPLFFGFATSWSLLNVITVILLMPTFIIYIIFAAADRHKSPIIIQPNSTTNVYLNSQRNEILKEMLNQGTMNPMSELKQRNNNMDKAQDIKEDDRDEEQKELLKTREQDSDDHEISYGEVIRRGLVFMDSEGKKWMKICIGSGVTIAVINSLIVFFSPCYIDVTKFVCD